MDALAQLDTARGPLAGFVGGAEHRTVFAAFERLLVAIDAGHVPHELNPLFLYGPPGCGKTHLVTGLLAELEKRHPPVPTRLLDDGPPESSLEVDELARNSAAAIEDVHRLARKPGVNAWLATLIDKSRARGGALVITSREPPGRLSGASAALAGRLAQGLTVRLPAPEPPTRVALLAHFIQSARLSVPDEVCRELGACLPASARAIKALVHRLAAVLREYGPDLTPATVARLLDKPLGREAVLAGLVDRVAERFQVSRHSLRAKGRSRVVVLARQLTMYLARERGGFSLQAIGRYFGNRDHTTVLYACRKIREAAANDSDVAATLQELDLQETSCGKSVENY